MIVWGRIGRMVKTSRHRQIGMKALNIAMVAMVTMALAMVATAVALKEIKVNSLNPCSAEADTQPEVEVATQDKV